MFDSRRSDPCVSSDGLRKHLHVLLVPVAAIALLSIFTIDRAWAQVLFGSIVGSVTDGSGAGVPGATIKVTQLETNETRETTTNEAGGFTLSTVHAGTYNVSIVKDGFKGHTTENVLVSLNTVVRVDAALQVGAQTQSIEVASETAQLQTERADVHTEFNSKQMIDLPQPTRTFEGIVALTPGIAPPLASGGGTNNPSKSFQVTADGTSRSGTNVLIDGVSATNPWVQFYATYAPSVEAIETVNVVTASSDAEQAMTNGASINVQTKSGTNQLHGSLYEYNIVSATKARPFFLPANQGIPKLIENDFGGTVGGRIIKNKLFYFGSYEGDFISQGSANSTVTVPTNAIKAGDFSASPAPIYDPATGVYNAQGIPTGRTAFPGNIIPASRINPASAKLVALVPSPNQNFSSTPNSNYYVNTPISNRLQHIDTKFDWIASSKWKVTGRYGYQPYNITQSTIFGPILGGSPNEFQFGNASAYAITATYIATPRFVVDANFGRTNAHQVLFPPSTDKKLGSDFLGIPGTNLGNLPYAGGMPQFNVANYSGYGFSYTPLQYDDPVYQWAANASWIKGSHNIRFGGNFSKQAMNHTETTPTSFSFNGGATITPGGAAANAFNTYADFLLGLPQTYANSTAPSSPITLRTWQSSFYVRDQWQVNKKLTVSLGTGWEYYPVPHRSDRQIESYNFATNQILICGSGPNQSNCGITTQKSLFSPRIGIAYRPVESVVIRAGYSLSPEQINMFRDGIYNYPTRPDFSNTGLSTYDPVGNLTTGIPVQPAPDISSGVINAPKGLVLGAIIPPNSNFVRGYTESMNFTVQKDFGHGWTAQAGYVGTLSIHQHTRYNINYGTLNGGGNSQPFAPLGIFGSVIQILPYETMRYNSFQAQVNHRFSNGFLFSAAYTRSKWIGTCCDDSGDGGPAIVLPQYTNLNRALMNADRPNNFRMSAVYDAPFGKGQRYLNQGGVTGAIVGGWHLQGIFSKYSGAPFSASGGSALNTPGFTQRAQQVKADVQYPGNIGPGQSYFDPTAFVPVTAPGVIGNAGYNTLRGPGVSNLDMSMFRDFVFRERYRLQFRAEALNLSNTPHFANPNGNAGAASFNPDGSIRSLGGYSTITGTTTASRLIDERYLRFGLKLTF
jgi:Carboxypeptidase regulatory-like domain/TonB-dependent Receptor Plug Domain/TonB dependent receptor